MSNKTSDENVENIERLNNFANMTFLYGHRVNLNVSGLKGVQQDIKNVLAELEQKDKRIQELEEENSKHKSIDFLFKVQSDANYVNMKKIYFEWLDSIPKQAVIDKIEEIKKDKDSKYYDKFLCERDIEKIIEILQELLQEEDKQ